MLVCGCDMWSLLDVDFLGETAHCRSIQVEKSCERVSIFFHENYSRLFWYLMNLIRLRNQSCETISTLNKTRWHKIRRGEKFSNLVLKLYIYPSPRLADRDIRRKLRTVKVFQSTNIFWHFGKFYWKMLSSNSKRKLGWIIENSQWLVTFVIGKHNEKWRSPLIHVAWSINAQANWESPRATQNPFTEWEFSKLSALFMSLCSFENLNVFMKIIIAFAIRKGSEDKYGRGLNLTAKFLRFHLTFFSIWHFWVYFFSHESEKCNESLLRRADDCFSLCGIHFKSFSTSRSAFRAQQSLSSDIRYGKKKESWNFHNSSSAKHENTLACICHSTRCFSSSQCQLSSHSRVKYFDEKNSPLSCSHSASALLIFLSFEFFFPRTQRHSTSKSNFSFSCSVYTLLRRSTTTL